VSLAVFDTTASSVGESSILCCTDNRIIRALEHMLNYWSRFELESKSGTEKDQRGLTHHASDANQPTRIAEKAKGHLSLNSPFGLHALAASRASWRWRRAASIGAPYKGIL
jgi:hypothetical protein